VGPQGRRQGPVFRRLVHPLYHDKTNCSACVLERRREPIESTVADFIRNSIALDVRDMDCGPTRVESHHARVGLNHNPKNTPLTVPSSTITEIKSEDDLIPPGAKPGTIPTDYIQATGLERLELIGKMQGIDIFDMRPLDASRKGMSALFALHADPACHQLVDNSESNVNGHVL
jgi:hypothetical protein